MFQEKKPLWRNFSVWMLCISSVFWHAFVYADNSRAEKHELKSLYEIAWERQPESKSYQFKVDAALAKQNACLGCHAVDKKVVGPSFQAVAKKYLVDDGLTIAILDPQARQSDESKQGGNRAAK